LDDKFLCPLVHFYQSREIEEWIDAEGMTWLGSGTHMAGMMLGFLLKKSRDSLAGGMAGSSAGKSSGILTERKSLAGREISRPTCTRRAGSD